MARLVQCGWELGDIQQIGTAACSGGSGAVTLPIIASTSPTPRNGSYYMRTANGGGSGTAGWSEVRIAHASKTDVWYSFGFYTATTGSANTGIWRNYDSAVSFVQTELICNAGTLLAYRAAASQTPNSQVATGRTLLGTASSSMSLSAWHLIEIHYVGATGATGTFEVWLDGVQVINATSVITSSNASGATAGFALAALTDSATTTAQTCNFDDLRVNDTTGSTNTGRPGDEKITLMTPNAAGDSTQWTPSTGSNYQCVDDIPPNSATDYVSDSTVGHTDLYNLPSLTVATVSAVNVIVQAQNPDGGGGSINLPTKTGAGQSDGSAQNITSSWAYYSRLLETDPADSAAWDQTKINALQIGVKVAS